MWRKVKEGQSGEKIRNQARSVPQVYSPEVGGVFMAREEVRNGLRFLPASHYGIYGKNLRNRRGVICRFGAL